MVTNLSSGFAAAPPGTVVPGSVTRIWQDDWERISLILEPPRPMTRNSKLANCKVNGSSQLTSANESIGNKDLLSLHAGWGRGIGVGWRTAGLRLFVGSSGIGRISILVLK